MMDPTTQADIFMQLARIFPVIMDDEEGGGYICIAPDREICVYDRELNFVSSRVADEEEDWELLDALQEAMRS